MQWTTLLTRSFSFSLFFKSNFLSKCEKEQKEQLAFCFWGDWPPILCLHLFTLFQFCPCQKRTKKREKVWKRVRNAFSETFYMWKRVKKSSYASFPPFSNGSQKTWNKVKKSKYFLSYRSPNDQNVSVEMMRKGVKISQKEQMPLEKAIGRSRISKVKNWWKWSKMLLVVNVFLN